MLTQNGVYSALMKSDRSLFIEGANPDKVKRNNQ